MNNDSAFSYLQSNPEFSTLLKYISMFGSIVKNLADPLSPITLFAPTNRAFEYFYFLFPCHDLVNDHSWDEDFPKLNSFLLYNIIAGKICVFDMYDGQLLVTCLVEKEMKPRPQKIHVGKVQGNVQLNFNVNIIKSVECGAGIVHVLENIMLPPGKIYNQLFLHPTTFSTFTSSIQKSNLDRVIDFPRITCLIPINEAWGKLPQQDQSYLFSPNGYDDLKKIMEYHIGVSLVYASDLYCKDGKYYLKTLCGGRKVTLFGKEGNDGRKVISLNDGEGRVVQPDYLARNGNIFLISSVLIPNCVVLPSMKED